MLGDKCQALLGPDQRLERGPLALELFLALKFFAFGDLIEFSIETRPFALLQFELSEAALVIDGDSRAVLHRALNVVNADVVAKYSACVLIREFDLRPGEANERGVRKCIAHVTC